MLNKWYLLLLLLLLEGIGIRDEMMTIPWHSPVDFSRQIRFLQKAGSGSSRTIMCLIFFFLL